MLVGVGDETRFGLVREVVDSRRDMLGVLARLGEVQSPVVAPRCW
jgi:hypothetical protein